MDEIVNAGEFDYLVIYVRRSYLERMSSGGLPFNRSVTAMSGAGAVLSASLITLFAEATTARANDELIGMLPDFTRLFLNTLERGSSKCLDPPMGWVAARRLDWILTYLKNHLNDPELSAAHVARECGISERRLYRDFAKCNESFAETLRRLRLSAAACRLATETDTPIIEISYGCGFVNPTHFARVFRAAHGATPPELRKARKALNDDPFYTSQILPC